MTAEANKAIRGSLQIDCRVAKAALAKVALSLSTPAMRMIIGR
jgi:hypothetical protein